MLLHMRFIEFKLDVPTILSTLILSTQSKYLCQYTTSIEFKPVLSYKNILTNYRSDHIRSNIISSDRSQLRQTENPWTFTRVYRWRNLWRRSYKYQTNCQPVEKSSFRIHWTAGNSKLQLAMSNLLLLFFLSYKFHDVSP